jgi:hypothetical protein
MLVRNHGKKRKRPFEGSSTNFLKATRLTGVAIQALVVYTGKSQSQRMYFKLLTKPPVIQAT